jgi:hypothetical protein
MATRAHFETVLIKRCGAPMAVVGMDVVTQNGTNADLNDPIRVAARLLARIVLDPVIVADGDLAGITGSTLEKGYDLAERRLLENILNNFVYVDRQVDRDSQKKDQLRQGLQARIDYLTARLVKPYGPGAGGPVTARIKAGRHRVTDPRRGNPWGWPFP